MNKIDQDPNKRSAVMRILFFFFNKGFVRKAFLETQRDLAMTSLKITAVSCGLMGILAIIFQVFIIFSRNVDKILVGTGSNKNMELMMRG